MIFQLGEQQAVVANNLVLLGVSLAENAPYLPLDWSIGQINNLTQGLATADGCMMSLATVGSCHVWTGGKGLVYVSCVAPDSPLGMIHQHVSMLLDDHGNVVYRVSIAVFQPLQG